MHDLILHPEPGSQVKNKKRSLISVSETQWCEIFRLHCVLLFPGALFVIRKFSDGISVLQLKQDSHLRFSRDLKQRSERLKKIQSVIYMNMTCSLHFRSEKQSLGPKLTNQ